MIGGPVIKWFSQWLRLGGTKSSWSAWAKVTVFFKAYNGCRELWALDFGRMKLKNQYAMAVTGIKSPVHDLSMMSNDLSRLAGRVIILSTH